MTAKERTDFRKGILWQLFRKYLLGQKQNTCEFCGKQYKDISHLNIHHIFETKYDELKAERFMVLCKTCHEFVHSKYNAPAFKERRMFGRRD